MTEMVTTTVDDASLKSTFYEQLVEHVFVSEVLQEACSGGVEDPRSRLRARQGMVVVVPEGDSDDPTRKPDFYDGTYEYLKRVGIKTI